MLPLHLLLVVALQSADTVHAARAMDSSAAMPVVVSPVPNIPAAVTELPLDTVRRRPHAIEYSDAYATRLRIHRIGSYTMLPLFAAEYFLGENLLDGQPAGSWVKPTHTGVALGLGALFTINTVTGVWNLWDSRQDPAGRTRRIAHTVLMLASDAGFAAAGATGTGVASDADRRRHKNIAIGSMALSTVGTAMMWFWKD